MSKLTKKNCIGISEDDIEQIVVEEIHEMRKERRIYLSLEDIRNDSDLN